MSRKSKRKPIEHITGEEIAQAVRILGLAGQPLNVHASLRSFGWVEGGARAVVQALLDCGCTVMVPTHSYAYHVPEPDFPPPAEPTLYTPASDVIDARNMGAIPVAVLHTPGRVRGNHPLDSFTALGPLAAELVRDQHPQDVYAPVRALAERDGLIVLMGVELNRLTALHHAERLAGRDLFHPHVMGPAGEPVRVRTGGCSEGFVHLDPVLAPIETRARVGQSVWRVFPADPLLELAAAAIRANPRITHCGNPECWQCKVNVSSNAE